MIPQQDFLLTQREPHIFKQTGDKQILQIIIRCPLLGVRVGYADDHHFQLMSDLRCREKDIRYKPYIFPAFIYYVQSYQTFFNNCVLYFQVNLTSNVMTNLVPGAQYRVVVYLQKAPLIGPPSDPLLFSIGKIFYFISTKKGEMFLINNI